MRKQKPPIANSKSAFTIDGIEKLPPSKKRNDFYFDSKAEGLCLRVSSTGVKSFLIRKWWQGKVYEKTLGRYHQFARQSKDFEINPLCVIGNNPSLTLDQARKLSRAYIGMLSGGKDPVEEINKTQEELTLAQLFNEYIERHAKKSRKTANVMVKDFERYAGSLKSMKLSKITHTMAEHLHGELGNEKGSYTANRTIQLLRAVYNKGKSWKLFFGDNPFSGISLFPEKPRERFLSTEEAGRLFKALKEEPNELIRDFITLSLLTGVRKTNLTSMRWSDIDFDAGVWIIPDTKNGTAQHIALGNEELAVLQRRKKTISGDYVFPSNSKTGHLLDPKKSWVRLRLRAGIADCTFHDLRRSLSSAMAGANVNVALIKSALHHKDMKTTLNVYAHTQKDAVLQARQTAHNKWFEAAGLLKPKKGKNNRKSVRRRRSSI